ncbi:MAG: flagellar hook-basal body complex protein [Candidatus Margulisbacteria bacterium]|nr:flagellar hook-basal body complex protein [Candidatus Margulisiibacteriota bacterium]
MLRSMFSGLAGLSNNQTALDVVGNNIANVNTVGYKSSKIEFTELLNQTIRGASSPQDSGRGGTNPIQVGLGVGTSAITVSHQQGNLQSTGIMSDLALQGSGFFILGDGEGQTFYTRAGSFNFDADGSLVHSSGMKAYGWMANVTGGIDRNSTIQALSIPVGQTISANPSTEINYAYNLDSRTYTLGTPVLATANSANVALVGGKFLGNEDDPLTLTVVEPTIKDVRGSHAISVYSETHTGENSNLNGTTTLGAQIGVTDISSFRVVIDGEEKTINLSNGTASSINQLISAINSQLTGVTATLTGGKIELTRTVAGDGKNIYVYDKKTTIDDNFLLNLTSTNIAIGSVDATESKAVWDYLVTTGIIDSAGALTADDAAISLISLNNVGGVDYSDLAVTVKTILKQLLNGGYINSTNGIASKVFGGGGANSTEWLPAAKTVGLKTGAGVLTASTVLGGLVNTNDLTVTANGKDYSFDISAAGISDTSKVADLISKFNNWALTQTTTTDEVPFYMGLNNKGNLFVTYTNANTLKPISIKDNVPADNNGIADLFFDDNIATTWEGDDVATNQFNKISTPAHINHTYTYAVDATTTNLSLNFGADDGSITGINGVTIDTNEAGFKTGNFIIQTVPATEYITSTTVYDSLGAERTVTLTFTREDDNQWSYRASGSGGVAGGGTLNFDSKGKIVPGIIGGGNNIIVPGINGADQLEINPSFNTVTQFADRSSLVHSSQDGYPNGSLSTYSISSDGTIIGIYSNGLNQNIGQIGVATFNNATGLLKSSDGMFVASNNSGEPQIGTANTGGRGTISAGTLEMSNVDIAKEFSNMIIYQRGFQANSKIITTGDEILQTLVNMKR